MRKITILLLLFFSCYCFSQIQGISEAEWFAGFDPGEGNGEPLVIDSGATLVVITESSAPKGVGTLILPKLKMGSQPIYIRVKSTGFRKLDGTWVPGRWSMPIKVEFPINQTLKKARMAILRGRDTVKLSDVLKPVDGKWDNVVETLSANFDCDLLKKGDTLIVLLQGFSDLWGGDKERKGSWLKVPVKQENLKLCTPSNLEIANVETYPSPKVILRWSYKCPGATGFKIERRDFPNPQWNEIYRTSKVDTFFVDTQIKLMEKYSWRIFAINENSKCDFTSDPSNEVTTRIVSVEDDFELAKSLSINVLPNPATDFLQIFLNIGKPVFVNLFISDILGQKIENIYSWSFLYEGTKTINLDIANLPNGLYFCVLQTINENYFIPFMVNK